MTDADLLTSPLHDRHVALGAKMADFGGWEMPIEYPGGGVVEEHTAVRERGRHLRRRHLGKASASRAPARAAFVNACLTNDLGRIAPGKAQYTLCCDETGGVVDDLIAYLRADDDVFLIPNAANTAEVVRRLRRGRARGRRRSTTCTSAYGVLAVQGPRSDEVLDALGLPTGHDYMSFVEAELAGPPGHRLPHRLHRRARLRAGPALGRRAGALWDALIEAAAAYDGLPCGLGARDTLRTEMGYPLHGQDLSSRSRRSRPAPAGRSAGRRTASGAGRRWSPRRPPAPRRICCGACWRTGRGIPRAHMRR